MSDIFQRREKYQHPGKMLHPVDAENVTVPGLHNVRLVYKTKQHKDDDMAVEFAGFVLEIDGKPVQKMIQDIHLHVSGNDLMPTLSFTFLPGALDVLLEGMCIELKKGKPGDPTLDGMVEMVHTPSPEPEHTV